MSPDGAALEMGQILGKLDRLSQPSPRATKLEPRSSTDESEDKITREKIMQVVRAGIKSYVISSLATFSILAMPQPSQADIEDAFSARAPAMAPAVMGMAMMSESVIATIDAESIELAEEYVAKLEKPETVEELQNLIETAVYVDLKARAPEVTETTNNARIPVVRILQNAVEDYGKPVTWQKSDQALDHSEVIHEKIRLAYSLYPIALSDVIGFLRGDSSSHDAIHHFKNATISLLGPAMAEANEGYSNFSSPALERYEGASGFAHRIKEESESLATRFVDKPRLNDNITPTEVQHQLDQRVIDEIYDTIAQLTHADGSRIQTSEVITHFLRVNDGNLNLAIEDTAVFYKLLTRGYRVDDSVREARDHGHAFLDQTVLFEDNFSLFARHFGYFDKDSGTYTMQRPEGIDKNTEILNFLGAPYHALGILSLMRTYDIETIRLATIGQQVIDFPNQGHAKTLGDMVVLDQLSEVESYLTSLSAR